MKKIILLTSCVFILSVSVVDAASVIRSGETVSVATDQTVDGDFYSAASIINISGVVTEDILAAGGKVTLNGSSSEDVLIIAGAVDIHGAVGEDVRIIAGETVLADTIAGDVFVLGGSLEVLSSASIGGDLLFFGGQATVAGDVGGDILGYVGSLRIDAPVAGDVTVTTDALTLGDRANIGGDLSYTSSVAATRAPNAVIGGENNRKDPLVQSAPSQVRSSFLPLLGLLFAALAWLLIGRRSLVRIVHTATRSLLRSSIIGFVVLFVGPLVATLLVISMIGLIPGLILWLLYFVALLLAIAAIIPLLGQLLLNIVQKNPKPLSVLTLGVGAIGVWVLFLVPIVGGVVLLALSLISLGAVIQSLLKAVQS